MEEKIKEEKEFLVPDYFLDFSCKMGDCRRACCVGWPVSISMKEYFSLIGLDCEKELRVKLDCGLKVASYPSEEKYARFEPRYDGNCPLRADDGRCLLHANLGEEVLPDVCRLYPRGVRLTDGILECSLANSCEAVLEILFKKETPIEFSLKKLPLQLPSIAPRKTFFETLDMEQKVRLYLISVIQNRKLSLSERIILLGEKLDAMDCAFKTKDKDMLNEILHDNKTELSVQLNPKDVNEKHLKFGLQTMEEIIKILDEGSQSIRECGEAALKYFGDDKETLNRYFVAKGHFEELIPKWEVFYENMLVNHMFFSQFPFQDRPESMHSEFVALCAVYAIMRFLGTGCMAEQRNKNALIDGMASTFRLIDHTEFDRYASCLLVKLNCSTKEQLYDLVSL